MLARRAIVGAFEGFADSSGTPRRGAATDRTWQRDPAADL